MIVDITLRKSPKYPYVFINGTLPDTIIRTLDIETSFIVQNVDFVLQNRKSDEPWDGRIRLLKRSKSGSYYIPVGLLEKVVKVLKFYEISPLIELGFACSDTHQDIPWLGPELRPYQIDAFVDAMKIERGIINLPTASGKTSTAIRIIAALGKPTLILVHRRELLHQWKKAVKEYTGIEPVVFTDKKKEFGFITVAMVQSLHNYLKKESLPVFDVLNVDEIHHLPSSTFYSVAMKCDARYRIGLTATKEREDGTDLYMEAGIGPVCISVSAEKLVTEKYLALPKFEFIDVPGINYRYYSTFGDEYKYGITLNESRNKLIVARAKQLAKEGRQVYIHVEQIAHGKSLAEMIGSPFVYSKTKDRDTIIDDFRAGKTPILISTLLGEGVDIPAIGAIIMAGGRKTKIGTIQKIGRALRPGKEKDAVIVDFIDKGKYLNRHTQLRYAAYVEFYGEHVNRFRKV